MAGAPSYRVKKPAFRIGSGSHGVFSSDSAWYLQLASYGVDIWDVAVGKKTGRLRGLVNPWEFVLSRDKASLGMSNGAGQVALLNAAGETVWRTQTKYFQTVPHLGFWGGDSILVVGTHNVLTFHDVRSGAELHRWELGQDARIESISSGIDQSLMAVSWGLPHNPRLSRGRTHIALFKNVDPFRSASEVDVEAVSARCAVSASGSRLAAAGMLESNATHRCVVLSNDLATLASIDLQTERSSCKTVSWTADDQELLLCFPSRELFVLGADTLDARLHASGDGWWSLSASADGKWIGVSGNDDGTVMPRAELDAYAAAEGPKRRERAEEKSQAFVRPAAI